MWSHIVSRNPPTQCAASARVYLLDTVRLYSNGCLLSLLYPVQPYHAIGSGSLGLGIQADWVVSLMPPGGYLAFVKTRAFRCIAYRASRAWIRPRCCRAREYWRCAVVDGPPDPPLFAKEDRGHARPLLSGPTETPQPYRQRE